MDDRLRFMMSALALGLVATLEGEEQPKSARANRCGAAHESILRVCGLYIPDGLNHNSLARIWEVLDGPVLDVIRQHKDALIEAVPEPGVAQC